MEVSTGRFGKLAYTDITLRATLCLRKPFRKGTTKASSIQKRIKTLQGNPRSIRTVLPNDSMALLDLYANALYDDGGNDDVRESTTGCCHGHSASFDGRLYR